MIYDVYVRIVPPKKQLVSTNPLKVEDVTTEQWQRGVEESLHEALATEGCVIIGAVQFSRSE